MVFLHYTPCQWLVQNRNRTGCIKSSSKSHCSKGPKQKQQAKHLRCHPLVCVSCEIVCDWFCVPITIAAESWAKAPRRQGAKAPRLVACFNGSICHMFTSYQRMNGYSLILFSDMMNNSSSFPYTMDYGCILPSVWKCGSRFWLPSSSHDLVMIACQPLSKSCWPRYSMPWFAHNIWGQPLLFVSDFQLFHMFAW